MLNNLEYHFPMTIPAAFRWLKDHGFQEEEEGKGLSHRLFHGWVHVGQPSWNCLEFVAMVELEVKGELIQYNTKTSRNVLECLNEAVEWAYTMIFLPEENNQKEKTE